MSGWFDSTPCSLLRNFLIYFRELCNYGDFVVKVSILDCDSNGMGSIPIFHPERNNMITTYKQVSEFVYILKDGVSIKHEVCFKHDYSNSKYNFIDEKLSLVPKIREKSWLIILYKNMFMRFPSYSLREYLNAPVVNFYDGTQTFVENEIKIK